MTTIKVETQQNVRVEPGEDVTLEVPGCGTTGYLWKLDANPGAVEVVGHEVVPDDRSFGGAGVERFTVRSVHVGDATVRLELKAPWESTAVESYDVTIQVTLRSSAQE